MTMMTGFRWPMGKRVMKIKGSEWTGHVVGFYKSDLTPEGYNIESENEPGSTQIYPVTALRELPERRITHGEEIPKEGNHNDLHFCNREKLGALLRYCGRRERWDIMTPQTLTESRSPNHATISQP